MCKLAFYLTVGIAVVLAMDFAALPGGVSYLFGMTAVLGDSGLPTIVNRDRKGDRLAAARPRHNPVITSVEVVGLRDAAIVYRDRDGRVLYQTDPLSNATVVARDVVLPDVTIRSDAQSGVRPVPVESPPLIPSQAKERDKPKIPVGCDPAFSPLSSAAKSNFSARCLADRGAPAPFATAMADSEYRFR
jgi:hypothetical protein